MTTPREKRTLPRTPQVEGLSYDEASKRFLVDGREIHCGDVTEVFRRGRWELVRWELAWLVDKADGAQIVHPRTREPIRRWYVVTEDGTDTPTERWEARWPK